MGSGKSSVGKLLAEKLGKEFIDLDEYIVEKAGMSIPEIFDRYGEKFFRKLEKEALREITEDSRDAVVATGGGVVEDPENCEILRKHVTFHLQAPWDEIWKRISKDSNRPLVGRGKEAVKSLYEKREKMYRETGRVINTAEMTVEEIAEKIKSIVTGLEEGGK